MGEAPDEVRNAFQQRSRWCKVCKEVEQLFMPVLMTSSWSLFHTAVPSLKAIDAASCPLPAGSLDRP